MSFEITSERTHRIVLNTPVSEGFWNYIAFFCEGGTGDITRSHCIVDTYRIFRGPTQPPLPHRTC